MAAINNTLSTLQTDPIRNFRFLVNFLPQDGNDKSWSGFNSMGFVSVSGLATTTESIAYREGGYNTSVHQIPGQTSFTPLTLSRGAMIGQSSNFEWMKKMFSVLTDNATGTVGTNFRCDLDIQVLTHPNPKASTGSGVMTAAATSTGLHSSMRFYVYNAWITNITYSNLDAGANAFMVEEMTLVHEGFDVVYAKDLTTNGSAPAFGAGGVLTPASITAGSGTTTTTR
jgi:phage tail-like protein